VQGRGRGRGKGRGRGRGKWQACLVTDRGLQVLATGLWWAGLEQAARGPLPAASLHRRLPARARAQAARACNHTTDPQNLTMNTGAGGGHRHLPLDGHARPVPDPKRHLPHGEPRAALLFCPRLAVLLGGFQARPSHWHQIPTGACDSGWPGGPHWCWAWVGHAAGTEWPCHLPYSWLPPCLLVRLPTCPPTDPAQPVPLPALPLQAFVDVPPLVQISPPSGLKGVWGACMWRAARQVLLA